MKAWCDLRCRTITHPTGSSEIERRNKGGLADGNFSSFFFFFVGFFRMQQLAARASLHEWAFTVVSREFLCTLGRLFHHNPKHPRF